MRHAMGRDQTLSAAAPPGPPRLDQAVAVEVGKRLREAELRAEARVPLIEELPDLTIADAYAIQQEYVRLRLQEGARVVGRKVGATNRVIQQMFGIDQPDYGVLFDDMILADGAAIATSRLIQPRVEVEVSFILDRALEGPGVTPHQVILSTAAVVPCFEIIDSRIEGWRISIVDTIADNGSSARVVLGHPVRPADSVDLWLMGAVLEQNGEVVGTGAGAAALGHPAAAVAWLANTLGFYGERLEEGHIVLPGAITTAPLAAAGDHFEAHFAGLGRVGCRFT